MSVAALAALIALAAQSAPSGPPAPPPRPQPPAEAVALLRSFDERSRGIRDFTADFTQEYRSGALGRAIVEKGSLKVKRPSFMRFEYSTPEKKLFLADGDRYYFYVPRDRQVMMQNQRGDRRATARILAEGRLLEHFDCVGEEKDPLGRKLVLAPKPGEKDADVTGISIVLDASLRLVALEIRDAEGSRSRLIFSAFRENVGLKDTEFRFDVPKGVEVIS